MYKKFFRKTLVFVTTFILLTTMFYSMRINAIAEEGQPSDPGQEYIEGTGTYFEITNSSYLNITLTSSENVYILLKSYPRIVIYDIESNCSCNSTFITLTGFEINTTYYQYQDGNYIGNFTLSENGSYSYTQDLTTCHNVFFQETISSVYIRSNGAVVAYGPGNKIERISSDLYYMTDHMEFPYEHQVFIERSNMTLNGLGHNLTWTGYQWALYLFNLTNVTITNFGNISAGDPTICILQCRNINITNCTIRSGGDGIFLNGLPTRYCENIKIMNCSFPHNAHEVIQAGYTRNLSIENNTCINKDWYLGNFVYLGYSYNFIISNCTVFSCFAGSRGVWIANCYNFKIMNCNISSNNTGHAIQIGQSYGSIEIINNTLSGFKSSPSNPIGCSGIQLLGLTPVTIINNTILNNDVGILIADMGGHLIYGNIIQNNLKGIRIDDIYPPYLGGNNTFYLNNFIGNTVQYKWEWHAGYGKLTNKWYNSTLSEGNYWSSYTGVDNNDDGIGDTSYVVPNGDGDLDCYPLMYPYRQTKISTNVKVYLGNRVWIRFSAVSLDGKTFAIPTIGTPPVNYAVFGSFYNIYTLAIYSGIITISMPYDPTDLPPGIDESVISLYRLENGNVDNITTMINTENNRIYGETSQLSLYACMVLLNEPPIADANGPYIGNEGNTINFDASASTDPNNDPLQYRWDFNNDETWDTSYSTDPTQSYTWYDDYSGIIKVEVYDGEETDISTSTITINNVAPIVEAGADQNINEGSQVTIAPTFNDPGTSDTHIATIDWQEGNPTNIDPANSPLSDNHTYNDNNVYTVTVTVTDDDLGVGTDTIIVTVNDLGPTAIAGNNQVINEGQIINVDGSGSFSSPDIIVLYEWDWTTDGIYENTGVTATSPPYMDNGVYTLTLRVTDDDGSIDTDILVVTVNDLAPIASYTWSPEPQNEGSIVQFTDSSTSYPDIIVSWSWDFDELGSSFDQNPVFTFQDNGIFTVTLTVTDDDGSTNQVSHDITILNIAPTITSITGTLDPTQIGTPVQITTTFIDPSSLDTYIATINWDDGNITTIALQGLSFNEFYTYATAGVYTITVTITDDDDGSDTKIFQYIVIYNPNNGFVTGGGWITSPLGAYTPDPTLTGKANFGFVSKYIPGHPNPSGNTEFNFKMANMNFHSENYDWLIIAGAKAMYKGTGTINGGGNYGFMLSAIDEELTQSTNVDLFRIKIWDKNNNDQIIYDNQLGDDDDSDPTTAIGGGNIKIHVN